MTKQHIALLKIVKNSRHELQYFIMKLCTHVLGSTLMVTSPKNMSCSALLGARPFFWEGGRGFGSFWHIYIYIYIYVTLFLENCSIFSHKILYKCSWYYSDGHCTIKKLIKNIFQIMLLSAARPYGVIWGPFWHVLLYFLRTIQYFIMKFCTYVLGILWWSIFF